MLMQVAAARAEALRLGDGSTPYSPGVDFPRFAGGGTCNGSERRDSTTGSVRVCPVKVGRSDYANESARATRQIHDDYKTAHRMTVKVQSDYMVL